MDTEPKLLNERLERLAIVLDEMMPQCALLVRDAIALLKEQEEEADKNDMVQVVRCKDCKYYDAQYCGEGFGWCTRNGIGGIGHGSNDAWFCADGERK